jgi:hypothetical protein
MHISYPGLWDTSITANIQTFLSFMDLSQLWKLAGEKALLVFIIIGK